MSSVIHKFSEHVINIIVVLVSLLSFHIIILVKVYGLGLMMPWFVAAIGFFLLGKTPVQISSIIHENLIHESLK